jgi:hypothetical protein
MPPEAPTEGRKQKESKEGGAKLSDITEIKGVSFSFLQTHNVTTAF